MFTFNQPPVKTDFIFGPPHAVLNLSKLGLRYFRIGIAAQKNRREQIAEYLKQHPNVGWVFYADGYFDVAAGFWARDNAEINDVSQQIRKWLQPSESIIFQSELTSLYGFGNRPINKEVQAMPIVDSTMHEVTLSPLEIDYIKLIALDSSQDNVALAELLNVSSEQIDLVRSRLTETGVIVGKQKRVQYAGYYYKVFIDSSSKQITEAEEKLTQKLWHDDACLYIARANSKYDLEFELILQNESDLKTYLQDFSDYQTAVLTENVYTNLYPVNKVANVSEIKEALMTQTDGVIDLRNSKLWYLNYSGAEAYLSAYTTNESYNETMFSGEVVLFEEIANYLTQSTTDMYTVIDIGSGDGIKGKEFITQLGVNRTKAYYPVDIQPIELAAALKAHEEQPYAKHPVLLDIEKIGTRFPLKLSPSERQVFLFFGGTYGNFQSAVINRHLKAVLTNSSKLLIMMPIVTEKKTDEEIIASYVSDMANGIALGPLTQIGLKQSDFVPNPEKPEYVMTPIMEHDRVVTTLTLKSDTTILNRKYAAGTMIKVTTSWKPTLTEFTTALEKNFNIEKMFSNDECAIALIDSAI